MSATDENAADKPPEDHMEDALPDHDKPSSDVHHARNRNPAEENGLCESSQLTDTTHDQLLQMVLELKFQNDVLKSHFDGLRDGDLERDRSHLKKESGGLGPSVSSNVKELNEQIESLSKELNEEKLTRGAAEEALKHLRESYSEADQKAQELSAKLTEVQQKLDQEIKEREDKYTDLDSKFQRLHKRAKQRIQEVQKEKDELELKYREANEAFERASSLQSTLEQELERARQQANEALKAMDAERQHLRSANNKLRDDIEDLHRSMQPKESAFEALQQTLSEKEQMLNEMRVLLQSAEEKRQAFLSELSAKHQKSVENLEMQIADALADRLRATDNISSLQVLVAQKESKIAEMDAASSGETARLRASLESMKADLAHQKHEHEKEKESIEADLQALKMKLEISESNCIRAEIEAAKLRSITILVFSHMKSFFLHIIIISFCSGQLDSEKSVQSQMLNKKDAELLAAKQEINRLESEFSSYKVRAHALLQKKDAELAAAKDSEQVQALEEALKDAERELSLVSTERDKALQDLQNMLADHRSELFERNEALKEAQQDIKSLEQKLDSAFAHHKSEKESWEINLQELEETWKLRCEALKSEAEASTGKDIQRHLEEVKLKYKKLKEEHNAFRDLADRMFEVKDKEISKHINDNKKLLQSLESTSPADKKGSSLTAFHKQDAPNLSTSAAEQQILLLARQQAQREEELGQSQRHILALQEEIEELERENRLHSQQVSMLKSELRSMERAQKREGVDMTYLKNIIVKLLETGEVEALLPVVAVLLQFSPEEVQKCRQAYRTFQDVPPPSPANDAPGSALNILSRFSFS
ncbi:Protein GRIP [Linum perenne]